MKDIKRRVEIGYTVSVYGTRESIYNQMLKDIESLLEENEALRPYNVVGQNEQFYCSFENDDYNKKCAKQCDECSFIESL